MAVEDRRIPTGSRIDLRGTNLEVFVFYQEEQLIDLEFLVSQTDTVSEGVSIQGGDLYYIFNNINDTFQINTVGDLIVRSLDPARYNIDNNGDLIYTTP